MRIIFFGSPDSAVYSLKKLREKDHTVEFIITQPDKPAGRGKKLALSPVKRFAQSSNIPVYQPSKIRKDPRALEMIQEIDPDINVVVAYGQIIPSPIIYHPKYNSVNLHFSLLPKYRGASPVHWSILNGEQKTGVTVFELDETMDTGDILAQRELAILSGENAYELETRLAKAGADLLCDTLAQIDTIPHTPQDHSLATYAPLLKKEDGRIDWANSASEIGRKIRAYTPWPSAFTFFGHKRIKIVKGKGLADQTHGLPSGRITEVNKNGIQVCCGQNSIYLIEELQPEGKRSMSAYSFSLGARISTGDTFA